MLVATEWAAATERGPRHENEDRWAATAAAFVLADGMGGYHHGETAARVTIEAFMIALGSTPPTVGSVALAVRAANWAVRSYGSNPDFSGMGSTLCAAVLVRDQVIVANVGDSRLYRYRHGRLVQLTTDHSLLAELIVEGTVNPNSVAAQRMAGALTRNIGAKSVVDEDVAIHPLAAGDRLVLCSDGVHRSMDPSRLESASATGDTADAVKAIAAAAAENAIDDATVLVVQVDDAPDPPLGEEPDAPAQVGGLRTATRLRRRRNI